jgi:hypothetical protein
MKLKNNNYKITKKITQVNLSNSWFKLWDRDNLTENK